MGQDLRMIVFEFRRCGFEGRTIYRIFFLELWREGVECARRFITISHYNYIWSSSWKWDASLLRNSLDCQNIKKDNGINVLYQHVDKRHSQKVSWSHCGEVSNDRIQVGACLFEGSSSRFHRVWSQPQWSFLYIWPWDIWMCWEQQTYSRTLSLNHSGKLNFPECRVHLPLLLWCWRYLEFSNFTSKLWKIHGRSHSISHHCWEINLP